MESASHVATAPVEARAQVSTLLDRVCDALVLGFAAWTVLCQLTVQMGGSLHFLMWATAISAAFFVVAWWVWRGRGDADRSIRVPEIPDDISIGSELPGAPKKRNQRIILFLAGLAALTIYKFTNSPATFWVAAAIVLTLAWMLGPSASARVKPPSRPSWELGLLGLCLFSLIVTAVAHRSDADDAGYLAMAVSVADDDPSAPMLANDWVYGLPVLHPLQRVYRAQTLEVLEGGIAYLTGLQVLDVAHVLIPTIAAFLVPLAYARLFRQVIPGRWIWGTLVVILFFIVAADTHTSYSNFAFVRLQQGKAIFLSVLVPLLIADGLRLARAPNIRQWFRLAADLIASVGVTISALWIAPLVAGLAVLCGIPNRKRVFSRLLLLASASGYLLLLGLVMAWQARGAIDSSTAQTSAELMVESEQSVLGQGPLALAILLVTVGGWVVARTPTQHRLLTVFPLGFLALWSPYWAHWLAENLTHPWIYWRVFWILPVPALLGIVLTAPLEWIPKRLAPASATTAACLAVAAGVFWWGSSVHTLSPANDVRLAPPSWKVPPAEISAACALTELVPAGARVVAPSEVETWIVTLRHHPFPLIVREHFVTQMSAYLGDEEIGRRIQLVRLVASAPAPPNGGTLLQEAIENYSLGGVCLTEGALNPDIRDALREAGLRRGAQTQGFEIWSRFATDKISNQTACPGIFAPRAPGHR